MPRDKVRPNTAARYAGASRRGGRALSLLLALCLTALFPAAPVAARQQGDFVERLREQIAALAKVDADANTPPDLRNVNRGYLNERRLQLIGALKSKAEVLRNYLSTAGTHLTPAERQPVEKSLSDLEGEVARLQRETGASRQGSPAAAALTAPVTTPPTVVTERPLSTRSAETAPAVQETPAEAPAAVAFETDCYPDPPPLLLKFVGNAAQLVVNRKQPAFLFTQINPTLFLAVADAVSDKAEDLSDDERSFINTIEFERAKAETRRTDKQVGASARAEGSTSAAEKPGFAELLGFAVEHGAIQQAVNGTSLTLSTSPYMLFLAGKDDTATAYRKYGYLSRLGISASFNVDAEDNPLSSARRQQLTEWSAKLRLSADRSARSQSAQQLWDTKVRERVGRFAGAIHEGIDKVFQQSADRAAIEERMQDRFRTPAFTELLNTVLASSATDDEKKARVAGLILCQVRTAIYEPTQAGALSLSADLQNEIVTKMLPKVAEALAAKNAAIEEFKQELKTLSEGPAFTLAYTNKREAAGSDYSTFKLLYSKKTTEGLNIVGNAGISFYHRPDEALNQRRVRDFAAALSFEGVLGRSPFLMEGEDESPVTFAFTGRYERMLENRGVAGRKADIGVAQFKVELPVFAGMSLPFSVTYANATELVKEDHVRANFGFTLDTDKIFQIIQLGRLKGQR